MLIYLLKNYLLKICLLHINQAISNLDGMTQQNAALVEEAAAASSLNDQANSLSHVVDRFTV